MQLIRFIKFYNDFFFNSITCLYLKELETATKRHGAVALRIGFIYYFFFNYNNKKTFKVYLFLNIDV